MDPNATLQMMIDCLGAAVHEANEGRTDAAHRLYEEADEHRRAVSEWIDRDGFIPECHLSGLAVRWLVNSLKNPIANSSRASLIGV